MSPDNSLHFQYGVVTNDIQYSCVITNSNGCSDNCIYNLIAPFDIFIPNAFMSNSDGVNDVFNVKGVNINIEMAEVYNRFGIQIYSGTLENGWDGRYKNELVEDGVYAYQLTYLNNKTQSRVHKNRTITVIR